MKTLPAKLKTYLIIIDFITFVSIYFFINNKYITASMFDFKIIIFFGVLVALTESFTVVYKNISFSTSFAITIAVFILKGPIIAIIVVIIGFSLCVVRDEDRYEHIFNTPFYKTLFNYCILILPIIYGDYVFIYFKGIYSVEEVTKHLIPISFFCLVNFLVNVIIISILLSIISKKSIIYSIFGNIKLGALNLLAMAPFGLMAAFIFDAYQYIGIVLFIFPIILARFTFSQYIEAKSKYIQTVDVIMNAMEARDKYTQGHSKRVADIACMIAKELKYNDWKLEYLNMASLLHDVGKIGIDDQILNKPGKLTEEEYNIIKGHPEIGYKILKDIKDIESVLSIVKHHHERYDGKGYPDGKNFSQLSLDVFIVQLADSIDAMATNRPYRSAMTEEEISNEIKKCKGTQFHPLVVDAYLRAFEKKKKH